MKYIQTYEKRKRKKKSYKTVSLESLVGEHILSGVDMEITKGGYNLNRDANLMVFILDGKTYVASEDPEDGYRSCLSYLIVLDNYKDVKNSFPEHKVIGEMSDDPNENIIKFIDVGTQEVVLEIGTSNVDDYYPSCVLSFMPENLELNRAMKNYNL